MSRLRPKFHKTIEVKDSELIDALQYDPSTWTLDARFKKNRTWYRYYGVGPTLTAYLMFSKSVGKEFNKRIKKLWLKPTKLPRKKT